ncbi:hypothetical protein H6784_04045 [Candidatus Nomurabacteria bacterium]|nr:hypothetical protein [Candidatus Kaiserbacteria bacterium]MCB9814559.1 hypothetical protein [Candidatus Nomurabacteria bacterium]
MKQQVFYIHGGNAYTRYEDLLADLRTATIYDLPWDKPVVRWTNTLREDLGDSYEVFKPTMPNSKNSKYQEWRIWFERHFEYLHDDIILVGWSQGGMFLTKYLLEETLPFSVKALFLIAAPFKADDFGGEDGGDFIFDVTRVGELAEKVGKISIFHSKDDFVVPYEHALKYKEVLPEAEFVSFEDKNHFLVAELPELIERIKDIG